MNEQRAKDLASIDPPSSMKKIVEFTEQLSFGQDALFAGTELPKPHIGQNGIKASQLSSAMASNPYQFFPGVGSEGLDAVMSRYAIRSRDIQDFTRWLMKWDAKRTELVVFDAPEQIFLKQATPELVENLYEQNPEIERIVLEGRRRRRVVEQQIDQEEVVRTERINRQIRYEESQRTEVEVQKKAQVEASGSRSEATEAKAAELGGRKNMVRRGHPQLKEPAPDSAEYWRESGPKSMEVAKPNFKASVKPDAPVNLSQTLLNANRQIITSNIGFGGLATGVIQGRMDATASFQAQAAAMNATQASPAAAYMPTQQASYLPVQGGGSMSVERAMSLSHGYPAPEVSISSQPMGSFGHPIQPLGQFQVVPGPGGALPQYAPSFRGGVGTVGGQAWSQTPDLPMEMGQNAGLRQISAVQPVAPGFVRDSSGTIYQQVDSPAATHFSGGQMPSMQVPASGFSPLQLAAIGGFGGGAMGLPGFHGATAQFAAHSMIESKASRMPANGVPIMVGDNSLMPSGSLARRDVMGMSVVAATGVPMATRGFASEEPPVATTIPNNPLMGQITLIAPPMRVASAESERAGSGVSFDIKQLAQGSSTVDASSLAMLKAAMPGGVQAIYPALPQGQLGEQAVNVKLAPSLLQQILTQGYGGEAAAMAPSFAAAASTVSIGSPVARPLEASIVPITSRPAADQPGILGGAKESERGLTQIGAAGASRGGALDFLGMPVRLAPSLAGNPEISQEAAARKVLAPGAAAVMRPNEFAPLKSKLFPSFGSVQAEPDKKAWEKAAPSFGMKSGRPESMLSPAARLKLPQGGAAVPQMHTVSQTPAAMALASAASVAETAHHAMPSGLHAISSNTGFAGAAASAGLAGAARAFGPAGVGAGIGGGLASSRVAVPSFGSALSMTRPMPIGAAGALPAVQLPSASTGISSGLSAPAAPGMMAAALGQRVASRWSPSQPEGAGPSFGSMPGASSAGAPAMPSMKANDKTTRNLTSQIPKVRAGNPASPSMTSSLSSAAPSMARPGMPTTAGSHPGLSKLAAPELSMPTAGPSGPSISMPPSRGSALAHSAPAMRIAASVHAPVPPASNSFIQRSGMDHGQVTADNSAVQETENSSARSTKDPGAVAHEINMLATEVMAILKRKMRFEAERLGRR